MCITFTNKYNIYRIIIISPTYYFIDYFPFVFVVGGLRTSMTQIAMLAGVDTPGRASQTRQVGG